MVNGLCRALVFSVASGVLAGFAGSVAATNGYSPTGFGTASKGVAGAGVALPMEGMVVATNPAGGVAIETGVQGGLALFSAPRGFDAGGAGAVNAGDFESNNPLSYIPHFAYTRQLEDATLTFALGANGGMNTDYDQATFMGGTAPAGVDFAQLFFGLSYAKRLNDRHSVGVMPIIAVQRFEAVGLEPFQAMSSDASAVTGRGYDYSWGGGVRVGWLGELSEQLSVGASLQSRLYMSRFDKYQGLFAEQGDFDVPPTAVVGLAYRASPEVTLLADYQRIWFGGVASLSNTNASFTTLGQDDGSGFGWQDIDILKLGVEWRYRPDLTLRAGISHATPLFEGEEVMFNLLAPATVRTHISLGFSKTMGQQEISGAYTHALHREVRGTTPAAFGGQAMGVEMQQNELELSWTYRF